MWRLLFIFSAIPIVAALVVRWYFGLRILADEGNRPCRCDLATWMPLPEDSAVIHRAEESAAEFGRQLRLKALAEWREQDPKAAAARENSRRFGMAVPPLSGVIAVFAVLVAKIPIMGGISCVLAATALVRRSRRAFPGPGNRRDHPGGEETARSEKFPPPRR